MKKIIISLVILLGGCNATGVVNCDVSIHIGTAYNSEGQMVILEVEEPGCPRIDTFKDF